MPKKKGLPALKKCGQSEASMMNAAFTEREWQKKEANDRVCRACMEAVRAQAGVLGQRGRLPNLAKNVLLSTSFRDTTTRLGPTQKSTTWLLALTAYLRTTQAKNRYLSTTRVLKLYHTTT